MVMLCLQTSCHRCPSALHNRLVTSTPSLSPLSLIHHVRVDASSITETPGPARARGASREKRTYPTDTPSPRPSELLVASAPPRGSFQSRRDFDPAKAATAPVIGIIIEFLPTDPCQTARGDSCARRDTTERHKLAQLRPVHGLHAHRL